MLKIKIKFTEVGYVLIIEDEVYDIFETHDEAIEARNELLLDLAY